MKRRISALVLVFAMVLTMVLQPMAVQAEETGTGNYQVTLPEGYDENQDYPVVYVLPQNGYDADNSGITEKLQAAMENGISTEMIIVRPVFTAESDIHAEMEAIVSEVDAKYSTIADADYRAVVGTGVGGYLAYILGLTEAAVLTEETIPAEEETATVEEEAAPVEEEAAPVEEEAAPAEEEAAPAEETTPAEEETTPAEEETTLAVEAPEVVTPGEPEAQAEEAAEPEYTTLAAPKLFKYVASIRGDFVSSANPWYEKYGDVYTYLNDMGASALKNFYTYIDAPVTDTWTNMKNSTNDIGSLGISQGLDSGCHEYTVRSGSFTDEFLTESVNRIADRMSGKVTAGNVSGTVSLTNSVLTSSVEKAEVNYTVNVNDALVGFTSEEVDMTIKIEVIDPDTDEVLTSVEKTETVKAGDVVKDTVEVDNLVNGSASTVQLSAVLLGKETVVATTILTRIMDTVIDGDNQFIDLMGDWYFHFTGNKDGLDVATLTPDVYESWSVVQPALDWWKKGFGDINEDTVQLPAWAQAYFNYMIIGDAYYVRTFELPENFDAQDLVLSVGKMDDRGQAYINGYLVGETGMVDGVPDGESAWELYSAYEVDPSILNVGGTNTIVIRCQNDGMGGGGWYEGPIALYSREAFENDERTSSLFIEDSFESKYAASAQELEGTVENDYMIYLPEGYYTSDKYYPTVYLLHQYNSTHRSYLVDDIDFLVDEAIKQALIDEMIVVVPNSTEDSWWAGDWMNMITEELVPLIDSQYRTIDDARYRFTAGCSMGGQGAYGVALRNPNMFSGAISFFGAFSMGGEASPNYVAENESAEYLSYYSMYFVCGNQDLYKFGVPAIELNQILESKGVEHEFFIENGEHDSVFYVPYFIDALVYTRNNMYHSDDIVETLMSGDVTVDGTNLKVEFEALKGIDAYYNLIPDSSYTEDATPDLSIPLTIEVIQDGEVVYSIVERDHAINAGDTSETFKYDLAEYVDTTKPYSIVYKAAVFDRVVELKNVEVVDGKVVDSTTDNGTGSGTGTNTSKPSDTTNTDKTDAVQTGDNTSITLYVVLALAAVVAMVVVVRMRKRA